MFRKKPFFFYKTNFICIILIPFSLLYLFCFFVLNIRFLKNKKICKRTICIGNIVLGGSGKTPVCIAMQTAFAKYFNKICFVSKGYGRTRKKQIIVPLGHKDIFTVDETGDEPLILSDNADVFIVKNRKKVNCHNYDLAICDDGFFDKSFHKDCTIAVFDGNFFIGNGCVVPAGPLRYTLNVLKKADFVIITDVSKKIFELQVNILKKYIPKNRILYANLIVKSKHNKKKYFAFSGIGENQKFLNSIKKYGINLACFIGMEDHQKYSKKILDNLHNGFISSGADAMITTSKDYVKLPKDFCLLNNVEVFDISYDIIDIDKIVSFVINNNSNEFIKKF